MRKSWISLLILSSACGHIKSEKPATIRDVSIDAEFKAAAEKRLAELDAQIADLENQLKNESNNREQVERELKQAMFLRSWESIRSIQPCGSKFPNLTLNLGKRVAYSFSNVRNPKAPNDPDIPSGPLNPGEYIFAGHSECPFRIELAFEPIDVIGQTALNLTTGEVQVQRVCFSNSEQPATICSTVLGDKRP